jgi:adenylate kinase
MRTIERTSVQSVAVAAASTSGPNIVLLGPPGAGKGTQASRIKDRWGLMHVASGDLLREHRASDTELGRQAAQFMRAGRLVPDELVIAMVLDRVEASERGVMLDGFPRTVPQAQSLASSLDTQGRRLHAVLLLDLTDEVVLQRATGRRVCAWGHPYHVEFNPPSYHGRCDIDGQPLMQRDDDRPETVRRRLDEYHAISEPLVEFYEGRGLLRRVDGARDPALVWDDIQATLAAVGAS